VREISADPASVTSTTSHEAQVELQMPDDAPSPVRTPSLRETSSLSLAKMWDGVVPSGGVDKRVYDALQAADVDGNGKLSRSELHGIVVNLLEAKETASKYRQRATGAVIIIVLLLGAMIGLTALAVWALRDTRTEDNLLVGKNGELLGTATALSSVPINLVPLLKPAQLGHVKEIYLSSGDPPIQRGYQVTSFAKYSDAMVEFFLADTTKSVVVRNGTVYIHTFYPPSTPPIPRPPRPPPLPPLSGMQTLPPPPPPSPIMPPAPAVDSPAFEVVIEIGETVGDGPLNVNEIGL